MSDVLQLLFTYVQTGEDLSAAEAQIQSQFHKLINNNEFYQLPLEAIGKVISIYKKELDLLDAKKILSEASKKYGAASCYLIQFLNVKNISYPSAIELLSSITGSSIFESLKAPAAQDLPKVYVDIPSSANIQLVFRSSLY